MNNVREGSRVFGYAMLGVLAVAVLTLVAVFAFGGVSQLTAPFRGETDEKNRTVGDGAFRVTSYDRFFELCQAVQGKEHMVKNIEATLKRDDLSEVRRSDLEDAVLANKNQRASLITQYNGLTANKYRAAYLDQGLPVDINVDNPSTECK